MNSLVRLNKIQFELLNYRRYYLLFFILHVFYCEDVFSKEVFIPADQELFGYKPAPLAGFVVNFTISDFNGFATSCKNSNDGSIDLTITGGSPPYTFSWSNSSTTEDIINLDAGNYSVLVSDSTGDTASFSFLLNEPDSLTIGFTAIQPICGNNNGISEVVVAGGISPYTVLWSTGDTSNSVSNLGSGMYSVIVSDLNSCQVSDSLELIDVGSPVINLNNITHVSCSGGANGALDITISGGTAPYTYSWSNNSPNEDQGGLITGTYTVVVTDSNSCVSTNTFIITEPPPLILSFNTINETCSGSNGLAGITVTGGNGTFSYLWSNGSTSSIITAISAGIYSVTVTDGNNCTITSSVNLSNFSGPVVTVDSVKDVACNNESTGAIGISVSGGTFPFSFLWTGGATSEDLSAVPFGIYTVIVTDSNQCMSSVSAVINEPPAISINLTAVNSTCGNANGSISGNVSGGTGSLSLLWSNGTTSASLAAILAGTYTLTVTDSIGCSASSQTMVSDLPGPSVIVSSVTELSCNGGNDGTIDISVLGGSPGFTFLWSNGTSTEDNTGLIAGSYSVIVSDVNNCTASININLAEPQPVSISLSTNNATCGLANGSVIANASGGTGTLSFSWSDGSTSNQIIGKSAGIYTLTVTDSNACTISSIAAVNNINGPAVNIISIDNVACHGDSTGSINIDIVGGTMPYTFIWSDGTSTEDLSAIPAGLFIVTVTDSNSCIANKNIIVSQSQIISVNTTGTDVTCSLQNGSVTVLAGGGSGLLGYLWSEGSTTSTVSGLLPGTYTVTVSDENTCTASASLNLADFPGPALTLQSVSMVDCAGGVNGTVDILSIGGTPPLTYLWNTGSTTEDIAGIPAAAYLVTVSDANNCTDTLTATITEPSAIVLNTSKTDALCGLNNGQIICNASGGTDSLVFLWSTGSTASAISNLSGGTYTVTVTDANNCTSIDSVLVSAPVPPDLVVSGITDVQCHGELNGSVNMQVLNGSVPFGFIWSDGVTTEDRTGMAAGAYTVMVTDFNACISADTVVINEPPAIQLNTSATNSNCNLFNGTALSLASGGMGSFLYLWSNGLTSSSISGLSPATYTITVTDLNNCTMTAPVIVGFIPGLSATATLIGNVICFGESTGFIDITVNGGSPPFFFLWSDGSTTEDVSNLSSGAYTVTVTDQDNCQVSSGEFVAESTQITSQFNIQNSLSGNPTGAITAIPTGGSGNYTCIWSTGATSFSINNLVAGTYTCTITDSSGCSRIFNPVVSNLTSACGISVNSISDVSCNGNTDGEIDIIVTGGIPPFTYLWSNAETTEDISGLSAGTYTVTVTDSVLCVATQSIVVNEPAVLDPGVSFTNGTCGSPNGTGTANPTGGNGTNSYLWSNGSTNASISGLAVGTYSVTVTDIMGCSASDSITISNPGAPSITTILVTPVTCFGDSNGAIDISVSGGTQPYTYSWSNGSTNQDLNGLGTGNYTILVIDSNNCQISSGFSITGPNDLEIVLDTVNSTCGSANGIVSTGVSGGTSPYVYLWSTGATTANLSGVVSATYTVTVTDFNNCSKTASIFLPNITGPLVVLNSVTNVLCNGGNTGAINITVSSGTIPYTYGWSNGSTTEDLTGIIASTYTITVTDANNCTSTLSATITEPAVITTSISSVVATCGNPNGSATASATGGTGAYQFNWSTGSTNATISGLSPATYTVTVTDINSCSKTKTVSIINVDGPQVVVSLLTAVTCNGGANGSIDITVSSGTPSYSYTWSSGQTTEDLSLLTAGTYTVTVTDVNLCTATLVSVVTQPTQIAISLNNTNSTCGNNNGSVVSSPSGGAGGYSYLWSNGNTNSGISGLAPGTYTVTVTDAAFCTKTATSIITNIGAPSVVLTSSSNISCPGGSNGSINITVSGGTAPYTYLWSNSSTTQDVSALPANVYSVIVSDANGCTSTLSATLTQPSILAVNISGSNATCGLANGYVTAAPSGGTGAFTFLWSNGSSNDTIISINAGTYIVTVTDANLCTSSASQVIINEASPVVVIDSLRSVNCNGGSNGAVYISITPGTAPYTYIWSNSATTQDLTGIGAGSFTVTVSDANGCTSVSDTIVNQPAALTVAFNKINATCGNNNGSLTAVPSGGTSGFSYLWSNGSTTSLITGLSPATYTVSVTDANGCTKTASSSVINSNGPLVVLTTFSDVSCNSGSDGEIDITVSAGATPYTYSWTNGATTQDITSLVANSYTVTVTDANSCTATLSVTISQPAVILPNITGSNSTCGNSNGVAKANPSGGNGGYTYLWSSGVTIDSISGLLPNTYTVTITDANLCTASATIVIGSIASPVIVFDSLTQISCSGGSNGSIYISVSQGTSPFTYSWSNSTTLQDLSGVSSANYTLTVTDANGCTAVFDTLLTQPPLLIVTINKTNATCGNSNGTLLAQVSGGAGGYSYLWSNGGSTSLISGLSSGTYTVTVTDLNLCTITKSSTISNISSPVISLVSKTDVLCNGNNSGVINIAVTGGTAPFTYLWSNAETNQNIDSLPSGNYLVTVTDLNGCSDTLSTVISQPAAISLVTSSTNATCASANGSVNALPGGGVGGFTYLWSSGATTANVSGLSAGPYTVTVTDTNNCTKSASVVVNNIGAPVISVVSITTVSCFGGSDGAINISVSGGTTPYTYSWSNNSTLQDLSAVSSGLYTVSVTDSAGCVSILDTSIGQKAIITINFSNNNATCGGNNGVSSAIVSGGTPGYSFLWSNSKTTGTITGLGSGNYTVTVTDLNGCTKTASTTIINSANPSVVPAITNVSCFGGNNGSIDITIQNGTPPYIFLWNNGTTNEDRSNLIAGIYTVTVTDSVGCVSIFSTSITQPSQISVNLISNSATCNQFNGSATVTANGGTGVLTFLWSNGSTTSVISNIAGGSYTITVTDASNCSITDSVIVGNTTVPVVNLININPVKCFGGTSGDINISVSAGSSPYTYSWSNGKTSQDNINVATGNYTVTVTGQNGCTITSSFFVPSASLIVINETITPANCGNNNGGIQVSVSGGASPYTYSWSTGSTTDTISGYASGNYSVFITDSSGCVKSKVIGITNLGGPVITLDSLFVVKCNGGNNGAIFTTSSAGTPPYGYQWSTGNTTSEITNLVAGTYTLTVTDSTNCISSRQFIITEPSVLEIFATSNNPTCDQSNGTVILNNVLGGGTPYVYLWSNGSTNTSITGLLPGIYTLTVTDNFGCQKDTSVSLSDPGIPEITLDSIINIQCNGDSSGSILITVNGGYSNYTYTWSNSSTIEDLINLPFNPGGYTVMVYDSVGCGDTSNFVVTEPQAIIVSLNKINASCGTNNGSFSAIVSGGVLPYFYVWSSGQTSASISGLAAGIYTLTVSDSNNCEFIITDSISNLSGPIAALDTVINVVCFGQNNGSISITVTGGTAPLTYSWSNGTTVQNIINLSPNTYTLLVTDQSGCTSVISAAITQPAQLTASVSTTNSTCGLSNGSAIVSVSGGNGGYTYLWNNSKTTATITGLSGGVYTVTVTDFKGCTLTATGSVLSNNVPVVSLSFSNDVSCFGNSDGSLNISVTGGLPPYSYLWSNASTLEDVTAIGPGSYTVTVTDNNGCTGTLSAQVSEPPQIATLIIATLASCADSNGTAKVVPSGGTPPYTYLWYNGAASDSIAGLSNGTYLVTITDFNGCTLDTSVIISNPAAPQIAMNVFSNVFCFNGTNGYIEIDVFGGTGPYTYNWNTGQTTEDIQNLPADTFTVIVTDQFGCSAVLTQIISQPDEIDIAITTVSATCGSANGSACLSISGGVLPYIFIWSNGLSTSCIQNLTAGNYPVTVTDGNGCVMQDAANVSNIAGPLLTVADSTNISCFNGSNGAVNISISAGNPPYLFLWSNGATTEDINGLQVGTYTVTVTDNSGCLALTSISLTQPDPIQGIGTLPFNNDTFNISCSGLADGSIDLLVSGGIFPYTYTWSNAATTQDLINLHAGTYTVIVTDSNGCPGIFSFNLTEPPPLVSNGGVNFTICGLDSTQLFADTPATDLNGYWQIITGTGILADSSSPGSFISGLSNGNVTLQWIITDGICFDTSLVTISVATEVKAIAGIDRIICGDNVSLTATPTLFGNASWSLISGTGVIQDSVKPTTSVNNLSLGENIFLWTVNNGNCRDSDFVSIQVLDPGSCLDNIQMPSGFSPNGDGKNEYFLIRGLEDYPDNSIEIYNRWGNLVYQKNGYDNRWNGQTNEGRLLPEGTYFVILKINNYPILLKGFVDLRR